MSLRSSSPWKSLDGDGLGIGELAALGEGVIVDVADGGDADIGDFTQRFHQGTAAAAGADAADVESIISGKSARGFGGQSGRQARRRPLAGMCDDA